MKIFRMNNTYSIICEWHNRRNGFKHTATLIRNGYEVDNAEALYINRTWEAFKYQTVIRCLLSDTTELTDKEKRRFRNKIG